MIGGGAPVARRAETARMAVLDASYDNDIVPTVRQPKVSLIERKHQLNKTWGATATLTRVTVMHPSHISDPSSSSSTGSYLAYAKKLCEGWGSMPVNPWP